MRSMTGSLFVAAVVVSLLWSASTVAAKKEYPKRAALRGWTTHGINNFRGVKIMDLEEDSNIWGNLPPIYEVGVHNYTPGAVNASIIDMDTSVTSWMANIEVTDLNTYFGVPKGIGPFNQPLGQVQTLRPFSTNISDRYQPGAFDDTLNHPSELALYRNEGTYKVVNLEIWNYARAIVRVKCLSPYTALVKVSIFYGISCGLYTVWDVGVLWPKAENETFSAGPFGGVPNVITTDSKGYGTMTRQVNYCPLTSCKSMAPKKDGTKNEEEDEEKPRKKEKELKGSKRIRLDTAGRGGFEWWPGGVPTRGRPIPTPLPDEDRPPRCLVYLSLFYHYDNMIYGGSPALDLGGLPIGQVGGNQIQIFFQGKRTKEHIKAYESERLPPWDAKFDI